MLASPTHQKLHHIRLHCCFRILAPCREIVLHRPQSVRYTIKNWPGYEIVVCEASTQRMHKGGQQL